MRDQMLAAIRCVEYLERFEIPKKRTIRKLSKGMKMKFQLAFALSHGATFLIMDEPDVFLDFENLSGLKELLNSYKGTILAVTHNRYLLHHCFNKILHLEDCDIQEFDGNYIDYNFVDILIC